jgi:hypothetical protein
MFAVIVILGIFTLLAAGVAFDFIRLFIFVPKQRMRTEFTLTDPEYTDIEPDQLSASVRQQFEEVARQLAALGFSAAMHARKRSAMQNIESYHSAWVCPEHGSSAHLYLIRVTVRAKIVQTSDTIFVNELDDGSCVFTTNQHPVTVPEDPGWRILHWPELRNLPALFEFHLKRVARYARGRSSVLVANEQMKAHARAWHRRAMEPSVRAGYYTIDEMAKLYRLTFYGAFMTTLRSRWPVKPLRLAAEARRLRFELVAVGMSDYRPKINASIAKKPGFPLSPT